MHCVEDQARGFFYVYFSSTLPETLLDNILHAFPLLWLELTMEAAEVGLVFDFGIFGKFSFFFICS